MLERAKPRVAGIAETSRGEFANPEEKRAHMQVSSSDTGTVTNNRKWVEPDQGSLQFFSGSHRCGLLGKIPPTPDVDLFDEYPELARFPISAPHHMRPGDATVHHGLTVHGSGANNAGRERWSFAVAYFPADARYTGAPNHDCDGFDLKMGHTIEHPSFSLVAD